MKFRLMTFRKYGKNASIGEMYREFTPKVVKIPNCFAVSAEGYWHVLKVVGILE